MFRKPNRSDKTRINVTLGDSVCDVTHASNTVIQCITNGYPSNKVLVQVFIVDQGFAYNDGTVQYQYIDLWSSKWTVSL